MRLKIFLKRVFKKPIDIKIDYSNLNPIARFFKKNESWILLLQTILVLITVYLTYFNIKLSVSGRQATQQYVELISNQLGSLNEQFSSLNNQFVKVEKNISRLPETVAKLDSTSEILGKQMIGLGENLSTFKVMLEDINIVAEKQLTLIKETQRQWEEELKRRPDLDLFVWSSDRIGDTLTITPGLINKGNKYSDSNVAIILKIPVKFSFQASGWVRSETREDIESWSTVVRNIIFGPQLIEENMWLKWRCSDNTFKIILPQNYEDRKIELNYILSHQITQTGKITVDIPRN